MNGADRGVSASSIPGLIWAYRFQADGTAERLADEAVPDALQHPEGWLWVHVSLADARARDWIDRFADLPEAARAILLSDDEHLRLDVVEEAVVGVLADLRRDFDRTSDEVGRLRFALTDRLLISARRRALLSVEEARKSIDEGRRLGGAVGLLEAIVEKFCDAAATTCEDLVEEVDKIEDRVVEDKPRDERKSLARVRRTAVRLHRQLVGLHSVFSRFERLSREKIPPKLLEAAHRLAMRLDTLHHDLHAVQERARLLQDEVSAKQAAEANRLLYIISILTALLVPPTLVTGIFGMNTGGLPLKENEFGTLYALSLCLASAIGVYLFMRVSGRQR